MVQDITRRKAAETSATKANARLSVQLRVALLWGSPAFGGMLSKRLCRRFCEDCTGFWDVGEGI